jgi:hypothetical protein
MSHSCPAYLYTIHGEGKEIHLFLTLFCHAAISVAAVYHRRLIFAFVGGHHNRHFSI